MSHRKLTTIVAISDDLYQSWMINLFLESLQKQGFESEVHILIFKPMDRPEWGNHFNKVETLYPNVKFFRYADDGSIINSLKTYHTLHRLFSLREHFKAHPELEKDAILYLDSDIILTKPIDLSPYLEDGICYGANVGSYNNLDYFDGKISRVRPERLEEYKREDPLEKLWKSLGVSRELLRKYNDDTAGVHYLLKNIDYTFWEEILNNCISTILHFNYLNQRYIEGNTAQERSNNGWQAFCTDIWLTLFTLWKRGQDTKHLPLLDFTWATDPIENVPLLPFFHCAGAGSDQGIFYKGRYANNRFSPMEDTQYIHDLLNSETSKKSASHIYVEAINELTNKYYKQ